MLFLESFPLCSLLALSSTPTILKLGILDLSSNFLIFSVFYLFVSGRFTFFFFFPILLFFISIKNFFLPSFKKFLRALFVSESSFYDILFYMAASSSLTSSCIISISSTFFCFHLFHISIFQILSDS